MKKIIVMLLLALLFSLCGCSAEPAGSVPPDTVSTQTESAVKEVFLHTEEAVAIRADSLAEEGFNALFPMENAGTMGISAVRHLPLLRFTSAEEFSARTEALKEFFQLDASYNGEDSFTEHAARFDEAFFAENELLMVYTSAASGSFRYEIVEAVITDGALTVIVFETRPEIGTDDLADWFILLPVPKADLADCESLDAVLSNGW